MATVNSSVDTVNAAATAIVTAEARAPPTTVQKRRWSSWWCMYWCFRNHKSRKRIGHAVLVPEPAVPGTAPPTAQTQLPSTAIVLPFIAPPSSPASFLQSEPSSVSQSPGGFLTNLSVNAYSPRGPGSIFTIGPYAYETQLVSPPVFSTFPTEPSTAPFTPPPELVQLTRPSSPEVPFARLLMSSLEGAHHGGQLISPGSRISYSGTSSPFTGKRPIFDCRIGEAPKLFGFEQPSTWKWGSRVGSGSLTPDSTGLRSRLGSGAVTLDSMAPPSRETYVPLKPYHGPKLDETVIDHRVSFELTGEDVARCLASKLVTSYGTLSRFPPETVPEDTNEGETEPCYQRQRSVKLGSGKEFNFDKPSSVGSEWWTKEKVVDGKETKPGSSWSFFPMLQPEVN